MENKLIEFIKLLRDSGVRISVAESVESYQALKLVNMFTREQFKLALRTTLIKEYNSLPVFDKLFDLYFQDTVDDNELPELTEAEFEEQLKQLDEMFAQQDFEQLGPKSTNNGLEQQQGTPTQTEYNNYDQKTMNRELYKQGAEGELQQKAMEIANSRGFEEWETDNVQATVERMMVEQGMEMAKAQAKQEVQKQKQEEIDTKHKLLKKYLRDEVEKSMVRQFGNEIITEIVETVDLMEVDLTDLTEDQMAQIKERVERIAKKISTRISAREKLGKRGKVSIPKTIRSSIQHGNVASELRFKRKKRQKPRLVVFCDVSGSVFIYVSFMLQLLLAIQRAFTQVESYVFVDKIKRITEEVREMDDDVFELVRKYTNDKDLGYASDFGLAFNLFSKEEVFDKKTVVIVVGDAINYGMDPQAECLEDIANQVKAIYWLNPLEEKYWEEKGCAQVAYEPHCKQVYECRNISQLEDFVKQLVKL